jgi:hypothetical protein
MVPQIPYTYLNLDCFFVMISVSPISALLFRLYEEGRTIRDITGLVHMSFRDIWVIRNKVKLQADREKGYPAEEPQPKSDDSRAFKLLSEGKIPVVASGCYVVMS